ncbi:TusE/DsrC/DsvC family sulfur relay protein [Pseudomonas aeruginosa]|nr:TusE/DsrC/DsvC family sulfur relay protein [Pseudomonas aeruginosa]
MRLDKDGYLAALDDWSEPVWKPWPAREELALTAEHWEILQLLAVLCGVPAVSGQPPLIKYVAQRLGPDKGNGLHLNHLFKGAPAKLGAKLADLPKPSNCL